MLRPLVRAPALVAAVGCALRVAWIVFSDNAPVDDQLAYLHGAETLATGRGFLTADGEPMALWPPGYSAWLALFFRAFGVSLSAASFANVVLAALGVLGCHRLARAAFDERTGIYAAWFYALYPGLLMMAGAWCAENAYCALLPWLFWLLVERRRRDRIMLDLAIALATLLLTYVKTPGVLLCLLVPVVSTGRTRWRSTAMVITLVAIGLAPWALRNHHALGTAWPFAFNGGYNLWIGNHDGADGLWMSPPRALRGASVVDTDRLLQHAALQFIREHPITYAKLCLQRTLLTLRSDTSMLAWHTDALRNAYGPRVVFALKMLGTSVYWLLIVCTARALVRRRRALGADDTLLALGMLLLSVPFVFILGGNRFLLPLLPLMFCWAAAGSRTSRT